MAQLELDTRDFLIFAFAALLKHPAIEAIAISAFPYRTMRCPIIVGELRLSRTGVERFQSPDRTNRAAGRYDFVLLAVKQPYLHGTDAASFVV